MTNPNSKSVGNYLRQFRLSQGLGNEVICTQTAIAKKAGVSNSYYSKLESGTCHPSKEICMRISHNLNIPPNDLLQRAGYPVITEIKVPPPNRQNLKPKFSQTESKSILVEEIPTENIWNRPVPPDAPSTQHSEINEMTKVNNLLKSALDDEQEAIALLMKAQRSRNKASQLQNAMVMQLISQRA